MKYLFIGGPANGRRVELEEALPIILVAVLPEPACAVILIDNEIEKDFRTEQYHRAALRSRGNRWVVYTHGHCWRVSEIVPHLIEHYEKL